MSINIIPPRYSKEVDDIADRQTDVLWGVFLSESVHQDDKRSLIKQRVMEILASGFLIKLDDQWRKEVAEMRKAS